jgi:hypothetical protein
MNDNTLAEDRLRRELDARASVLTVDAPPVADIAHRARSQRRRHRAGVALLTTAVIAAGTAVVVTHTGGDVATKVPPSGEPTTLPPGADPDVTHVVLDGWKATYYIDDPSHSATPDYVEYQWQQTAERRDLQLSFYAPNTRFTSGTISGGTTPDGGEPVPLRGTTAYLIDEGASRYRVDWSESGRDWEADGTGYANPQAFLDVVASIHRPDHATWLASLPAGTVDVEHRPAAVDALLAGVPVPSSVDVTGLRTASRASSAYDLAFDVYGQVECGWIAQLDAHRGTPAGQQAGAALGTVAQWPGMRTLDTGGGAGGVLRTTAAQALAGHTDGYREALGC